MSTENGRVKAKNGGDGGAAAKARLLKASEVQERLGIGRSTVYELMASGELPSVRIGPRLRRVTEEDMCRYVEEHRFSLGAAA